MESIRESVPNTHRQPGTNLAQYHGSEARNRGSAKFPPLELPYTSCRPQSPGDRSWTLAEQSESASSLHHSSNLQCQPIEAHVGEAIEPSQPLLGELGCSQRTSGAAELDCQKDICEECSECEQICEDCITDCESDCGVLLECDGVDCLSHSYCDMCDFEPSDFDLLGRRVSFWSTLTSPLRDADCAEIGDSSGAPEGAASTACVGPWISGNLLHSREEIESYEDCARVLGSQTTKGMPEHSPAPAQDHVSTPCKPPAKSGYSALAQCQWDDPISGVCGQIFESADDLHDHLRVTHDISSQVFCRWTDCRCGHTSTSPHHFAGGVLRHTWGHSGYRPYKCPTCRTGFAAADVRDEHVANVHLGQKMYSCDVPGCGHKCSGISNLRRHKQDRHGAEQFQCEFCNQNGKRRTFSRPQNLRRHFKSCKFVRARFPEARRAASRKDIQEWLPPGYGPGPGGMNRAKAI